MLATTRQFATGGEVHSTNVYLNGTHCRVEAIHGDALVPRAFSAVTYKIVPPGTGNSAMRSASRYTAIRNN
jgi:hypothetical protein